jgi:hypothetical protein
MILRLPLQNGIHKYGIFFWPFVAGSLKIVKFRIASGKNYYYQANFGSVLTCSSVETNTNPTESIRVFPEAIRIFTIFKFPRYYGFSVFTFHSVDNALNHYLPNERLVWKNNNIFRISSSRSKFRSSRSKWYLFQ